ncbi:EMC3/TMCO1 family protein [Halomontanus rarus]|uniref:EMC3/TMCO1 family protein n=1 Tax=Halomontanus rarus TaxID=3034020 RepID=UPI001A98FA35
MTRTAEKIDALVREDSSMLEALESIRAAADENGGEVEWADVRDDLSSGQWGRIIEKGVLIDGEEGFRIEDRAAFDDALDGDADETPEVEIDEEASKWSQWDKMAGMAALLLMVGYWFDSVRRVVGGTIDIALSPLDAALPFYAVILSVAMLTGLYSTLLQANLMNMDRISKYQERMKGMQDKRKDVQERKKAAKERGADEAELERLDNEMQRVQEEQMEAMADNLGMFKEQFRPMVWIMLFTIPLFLWMYWMIRDGNISDAENQVVMPIAGVVQWNSGIIGPMQAWIVWYFLCSMGFTQLLRKSINIDMTPTG